MALDADTQFNADTISRLVRWFADPKIGAVAGNAKVGNRINMITRWQALEYIVAQNLERRALSALGHADRGARRGGRLAARRRCWNWAAFPPTRWPKTRISPSPSSARAIACCSTPRAIAWTEAPATFRGLGKQRFRWAYGTLQCLWKYRRVTFNPRYGELGMVALPQVWLFQIILTTLAPLADLLLVWQLVGQWIAYLAARRGIHRRRSRDRRHLLCRLHGGGSAGRADRLSDGAARGLEPAVVADAAALRLSPADVLCRACAPSPRRCAGPLSAGASSNATAPSRQATHSERNASSGYPLARPSPCRLQLQCVIAGDFSWIVASCTNENRGTAAVRAHCGDGGAWAAPAAVRRLTEAGDRRCGRPVCSAIRCTTPSGLFCTLPSTSSRRAPITSLRKCSNMPRPHHHIADAGFVAEGDEDGVAFARPLAHQHHAGAAHKGAIVADRPRSAQDVMPSASKRGRRNCVG